MTDTLRARQLAVESFVGDLRDKFLSLVEANAHQLVGGQGVWAGRLRDLDSTWRKVKLAIAADEQAAQQEREPTPAPKLHDWYGPALKETTWGPTGWRCQCGRWYATEGFAKACGRPIPVAPDPVAEIIREHRSAGELASNVCYCGAILKRPTLGEADIAHVVHVAGLVREAIAREGK